MAYIGKQPVVGNFQKCDAITVVNGQAAYTLNVGGSAVNPENANHMLVSLNGVLQAPGDSFTVSGSTLTFASNLATGDVIDFVIILGDVLDLGTPSDNSITTAKLASDAVTAAKIADDAVESEHLNNNIISGQTALAESPADTDEFLVSDGGTIKRIDYSHIKGGGQKTLLATTTLSSSSSAVFNNTYITSTYRDYHLTFSNVHLSGDGAALNLHFSNNNGSSYETSNFHRNAIGLKQDGDNVLVNTTGSSNHLTLTGNQGIGSAAGETGSGHVTMYDLLGTDNHKSVLGMSAGESSSGIGYVFSFGGSYRQTHAINAIKIEPDSGNMASGVIKFYGIT